MMVRDNVKKMSEQTDTYRQTKTEDGYLFYGYFMHIGNPIHSFCCHSLHAFQSLSHNSTLQITRHAYVIRSYTDAHTGTHTPHTHARILPPHNITALKLSVRNPLGGETVCLDENNSNTNAREHPGCYF